MAATHNKSDWGKVVWGRVGMKVGELYLSCHVELGRHVRLRLHVDRILFFSILADIQVVHSLIETSLHNDCDWVYKISLVNYMPH